MVNFIFNFNQGPKGHGPKCGPMDMPPICAVTPGPHMKEEPEHLDIDRAADLGIAYLNESGILEQLV